MENFAFSLPTLLILVPVAGALICMSMLTRGWALLFALATFVVETVFLMLGGLRLGGSGPDRLVVSPGPGEWFPVWNINYDVQLDEVALGLIGLVTLVTACASVFAWYADRPRPGPFQGLLWLSAAGLIGLFLARDLVLWYVFFELMLVPLLFLVGAWGGPERVRAALTMFVYTLVGSLLMLVGVIAVGVEAGTFNLAELATIASGPGSPFAWWMFAVFVLAFAIKAPLVPFHAWMPLAYRQAPIEVTAVLSGLVSKAAMWGFLVVVLPLFPRFMSGAWGAAITWLAIISLLYGSITAFRQPDARGVVAYSSLAQMGLIVIGLSVYLGRGGEQGVAGAYLQAINHGLISASLFLLIGVIELRAGTSMLARLGGLATGRPVLATLALIVTMCALAVPGSNAFAGELLILVGAFQGAWEHAWVWAALASVGVVLAAMYALRLLSAVLHSPEPEGAAPGDAADGPATNFGGDLRVPELAIVLPLVITLLTLSAWPNIAREAMNGRAVSLPGPTASAADTPIAATGERK